MFFYPSRICLECALIARSSPFCDILHCLISLNRFAFLAINRILRRGFFARFHPEREGNECKKRNIAL